ncbi:hypothetical protein L1987_16644 [Smallanthus sonchifolius]|uniref:Uncharacterized protein n=1 Tax=Smallanthus sonchifolius TaxID=185202 RepID=A0ACB9IWR3_9ASTR|nr:hypothetical protein L1987_16644 [Smallanthus sonchifolius]
MSLVGIDFWVELALVILVTASLRVDEGVEVACRARIWTGMSRPPTGSDDPCDWQTNWSRVLVRVGETKPEVLLSGVEVQGTALSSGSPEKALDRRSLGGTTGKTNWDLAGMIPEVWF